MNVSYTLPKIVSYNKTEKRNIKNDIDRIEKFGKLLKNYEIIGLSTDGDEYTFYLFEITDEEDYDEYDIDNSLFKVSLDHHDLKTDPVYEFYNFCISKGIEIL